MQLDGLLYLYILFRRRSIDFFHRICAGPVNAITWKIFRLVRQDPDIEILGTQLTGLKIFHVIAKLTFVAFNRRVKISANQASPAHVIRPLVSLSTDRAAPIWSLVRDISLCSWVEHFTLTVSPCTQGYKWVVVNLHCNAGNFPGMD